VALRLISRRQIDDGLFAIINSKGGRERRGMDMKACSDVSFVAVREREKNEPLGRKREGDARVGA